MATRIIEVSGNLSDVMPGDTLYCIQGIDDNIKPVTVVSIELLHADNGYHVRWVTCKWTDDNGVDKMSTLEASSLYKSKEELLQQLRRDYMGYINDTDARRKKLVEKLMWVDDQLSEVEDA